MLVNFSYSELLQISSALNTIDSVYGNDCVKPLLEKVNNVMDYMDTAPITDIYPHLSVVK